MPPLKKSVRRGVAPNALCRSPAAAAAQWRPWGMKQQRPAIWVAFGEAQVKKYIYSPANDSIEDSTSILKTPNMSSRPQTAEDKGTNVKVVVRCRPFSLNEKVREKVRISFKRSL